MATKDFTKYTIDKKSPREQLKTGAMKCNRCNVVFTVFGAQVGDPCGNIDKPDCTGTLIKQDAAAIDRLKRKTDGAA